MKKILGLAALAEAGTGLIVLVLPTNAVRLLFGAEVSGTGILVSRIFGLTLIALAVACWPGTDMRQAFRGMWTYSTLIMLYLIVVGVGGTAGILLWPAVAIHAVLSVLLVRARFNEAPDEASGKRNVAGKSGE